MSRTFGKKHLRYFKNIKDCVHVAVAQGMLNIFLFVDHSIPEIRDCGRQSYFELFKSVYKFSSFFIFILILYKFLHFFNCYKQIS